MSSLFLLVSLARGMPILLTSSKNQLVSLIFSAASVFNFMDYCSCLISLLPLALLLLIFLFNFFKFFRWTLRSLIWNFSSFLMYVCFWGYKFPSEHDFSCASQNFYTSIFIHLSVFFKISFETLLGAIYKCIFTCLEIFCFLFIVVFFSLILSI